MPSTVFKPVIPASNGPKTHVSNHSHWRATISPPLPWICPLSLKQKYAVAPSALYCNLDHFTFSYLSQIYHINVQQHAAFVTLSHVILFTQKNENQTFTQSTTPFPTFDKTVFRLSEIHVGTKWPGVTDIQYIHKVNYKVVPEGI